MINEQKVRMMTQIAMIQKQEKRRAVEICGYRKKDYVSFQMIKTWICYTVAYLILTGVAILSIGGSMKAILVSESTLLIIACVWIVGYLGFLSAALVMARRCYNRRYRAAAVTVRLLRQHLMELEDYYTERSSANDSSVGASAKGK